MNAIFRAALFGAVAALAGGGARAATTSANLTVTATVVDNCSANDATLAFGTINPSTGVLLPATSTINVTCSLGTAFTVGLGDGSNASGGERRMKRQGSSDFITYRLWTDLLMTTRFGDTGSSDRSAGLGLGLLPTAVPVFGTVPGSQSAPAGNYSDTVQITVYY